MFQPLPHARWIRSFSCTDGHEQTPRIAHALGLKTLVGAWLGTDAEINERELQGVIDVARAGHADIVAVGNEVLLREDMSEDELLACIQRVKDALPGVPVGYVDAYYLFEKHPRITAACDVVMTNCYPFWEGCPREQALAYMQTMVARTRAAAPGKRVLISETGWPDQGSAFHGSVPSREGAMQYFVDCCRWAAEDGIENGTGHPAAIHQGCNRALWPQRRDPDALRSFGGEDFCRVKHGAQASAAQACLRRGRGYANGQVRGLLVGA